MNKVFEWMVLSKPSEQDIKEGREQKILISPTQVLAKDVKEASEKAMNKILAAMKNEPFDLLIQEWGH